MRIVSYRKMPKKYFDICEARRCPKEAKHVVTIISKGGKDRTDYQAYSFCDKHLQQFKDETGGIICQTN